MARVTIVTVGSRGDVQPYVALGKGLQAAGHAIRLATHAEFEAIVREGGLGFAPLSASPRQVLESETGRAWMNSGSNPVRFVSNFRKLAESVLQDLVGDTLSACQDTDVILYGVLGFYPASAVAERLRLRSYAVYLQPLAVTRAFAIYPFPLARLPVGQGTYNWLTHVLRARMFGMVLRAPVNKARQAVLGLPPAARRGPLTRRRRCAPAVLFGYSPSVLPKPPDWGTDHHVTGYWFLDRRADWQPPDDLLRFLDAGPPPVCVGFGSMNNRDPQAVAKLVLQALAQTGQRGVLLTGWGGMSREDLPRTVFKIDEVPHDWLLPQMAAAIHHGGAGTTAAALRAGIPSVVVPFFADQTLWAHRVEQLGVGPTPIPRRQLSPERLAAAIHTAVRDSEMRQHASALGDRIRAEDGVTRAVSVLQSIL
jgi:UDP:flavonoid glycosyltransferase YjiC (YdhE family)